MMKKALIITTCIFLLLIGYRVYLLIWPETYVDESVAHEIHGLLVDNGYEITVGPGTVGFNAKKIYAFMTPFDEELEVDGLDSYPEIFSVDVFLYSTENDAIIKTGQFSPKGDAYLGDNGFYSYPRFSSAPRYYRLRNAIIMYCGVDPAVRDLLDAYCGKPFAGS